MDLLLGHAQTLHTGYPLFIFYLVALIGGVLLIIRPYWAFLFVVFCLSARNFHAAVFTRTPFFGPFLNLNDLLLWIALFAVFLELFRRKKAVWAPPILLVIFGLIMIGNFQSLFMYGFHEHVLRRIWSAAIFPIMFLIAANIVYDTKRARSFYWALFVGVTIAAIQHILFIYQQAGYGFIGIGGIRTISFMINGSAAILIGSIFASRHLKLGRLKTALYYAGLVFIGLSLVLNFTRGLWVVSAFALVSLPFLIGKWRLIPRASVKLVPLVGGAIIAILVIFPNLEVGNLIAERFHGFTYREGFAEAYRIRLEGARTEIDIWLNSSLILGVGSTLPLEFIDERRGDEFGALRHVAFSTYLAHYGLLGLIIYLILLPILTLKVGKRYYLKHSQDYGGRIAIIGIACAIMHMAGFLTSTHLLGATTHAYGLLYGAVWGLYRGAILEDRKTKNSSNFGRTG